MNDIMYSTPVNRHGQELLQRGTPLFPCSIYHRDIHQYPAGEVTLHWHQELEFFILEEGNVHISTLHEEFDLQAGEAYFVNANQLHGLSCNTNKPCRYRSIVFDTSIISGMLGTAFDILYVKPVVEQGPVILPIYHSNKQSLHSFNSYFNQAYEACHNQGYGYEFDVRYALSKLLLAIKKELHQSPPRIQDQREQRMKHMISWLEDHYQENITIEELAKVANICARECQRYFSEYMHITPIQYLTRLRISISAELLISSDITIYEVGIRCGFDSPSYFTKQFKSITGMSPKQYRAWNSSF